MGFCFFAARRFDPSSALSGVLLELFVTPTLQRRTSTFLLRSFLTDPLVWDPFFVPGARTMRKFLTTFLSPPVAMAVMSGGYPYPGIVCFDMVVACVAQGETPTDMRSLLLEHTFDRPQGPWQPFIPPHGDSPTVQPAGVSRQCGGLGPANQQSPHCNGGSPHH